MTMDEAQYRLVLEDLYRYLSGLVSLSAAEFGALRPYLELRQFGKKEQVTKLGEVEDYLNCIVRGLVRKFLPIHGEEVITQLAAEGQMIYSQLSFNYRRPSESILETIEPTVMVSIRYDKLELAYRELPWAERLGRLVVTDLFIRRDSRYFDQLKKSTRQIFLEYVEAYPHMVQRVPQKYLASYLNIKPETFSRLKHLLYRKK